jgi:hypothetical protein
MNFSSSNGFMKNANRRIIWIADAHRGDEKRFVVRADELLAAFLELEIATSGQRDGFLGKRVCRASGQDVRRKVP